MNWIKNQLAPFVVGGILCGITFLLLGVFFSETDYLYGFFFRFWPIQVLSTYLFGTAMSYFVIRYFDFRNENSTLHSVQIPVSITHKDAQDIIDGIPEKFRHTICFRRLSEILKGYLLTEDVMTLNHQLSSRDMDYVSRGHSLLNSMRNIIPVVGFLGTVIGLSLGMVKFPELASKSAKIEDLKIVLKDFAASLSIAFDTTLLALVYTVIIIIISSVLLQREGALISSIDEIARDLIIQLKGINEDRSREQEDKNVAPMFDSIFQQEIVSAIHEGMKKGNGDLVSAVRECLNQFAYQTNDIKRDMVKSLKQGHEEVTSKLDEIKDALPRARNDHAKIQTVKSKQNE